VSGFDQTRQGNKKFHRVTVTAVMVLSVLFVADVANAATPSAQKVCVNKSTGVMRYVLKRGKQNCKKFEVRLMWNQAGATGPAGPAGAKGINGINGATGSAGATGASGSGAITQLSVCGAGGTELCKIGMTGPGGGHIFFVDYNDQYAGFNYLEAAPVSCEETRAWSSANTAVTATRGWAADAVGQGQANTTAILAVFEADTSTNNAAKYADSLDCGSKTDWWLGSIGEMMLMYTNLRQAGVGGFSAGYYWSSSELDDTNAWGQRFSYGDQNLNGKTGTFYVRPVRAF
jgi:hypothetical protein